MVVLGQLFYPLHMAIKFGIKLIFFGEDGDAEYGSGTSKKDAQILISMDGQNAFKGNYI